MNYLAHAYLSFSQPGLVVGNLISDFVKGRKQYDFPEDIVKGIRLHRAIDELTDNHEATRQAKVFFRPAYRLYAGAFTDVVYDHFLATDQQYFPTTENLGAFAAETYSILQSQYDLLPPHFQQMLPNMVQYNWLFGYRTQEGIGRSMNGLVRRSAYLTESSTAFAIFQENYAALRECFQTLFPDLVALAKGYL